MVKVSVIMPVFNAEDYLRESMESILSQTMTDLELICVDDGSQDNSLYILNEMALKDTRIRVVSQTNQGAGAARNNAMIKACGEYVYFMDADDSLELNALAELYRLSKDNDLDFAIFKAINYAEDTGEYFETDYYNMDRIREFSKGNVFSCDELGDLMFAISVTPWCKFYNREFVEKSHAKFLENSIFDDLQFFWEVLFNARRIYFYDKQLYTRRRHSASSMGSGDERYINIIRAVNGVVVLFEKYGKLDSYKEILYNKKVFWIYTRYNEIQSQFKDSFYCEMKRDFKSLEETDFKSYLDEENGFIFEKVISSRTLKEFDLWCENYRLAQENARLKNHKKMPNFVKYKVKQILK